MSNEESFYQINEPIVGIRFFNGTPLIGAVASAAITSDLTVIAGQFRGAPVDPMFVDTESSTVARKILTASSFIEIEATKLTVATEIRILGVYSSITTSLSAESLKFAKASASLSSTVTSSFSAIKIRFGNSSMSTSLSLSPVGRRLTEGSASIGLSSSYGVRFTTSYGVTLDLQISSSVSLYDLIRFTANSRYPGSLIPLIYLDGMPLTEQNRKYDMTISPIFIENKNWNNTKSRYYKRSDDGRMTFKLAWSWLPNDRNNTVDKGFARDYIKNLANDLDAHVLKIIQYGENPEDIFNEEEYTVFITNYTEDLIRRDLVSGTYFWDCSLDLEQA
jgi:hypothetical protein